MGGYFRISKEKASLGESISKDVTFKPRSKGQVGKEGRREHITQKDIDGFLK